VIERDAVIGRLADPQHPLFRLADLSHLWLTVHVFERDALRVRSGAIARLTFAALPGRTFAGTVTLIGLQVESDSRTIPVRVEFANVESLLRPGMSATAWMPLGEANEMLVAVPTAALQRVADGWTVFLPRGEGQFEMRMVGRGRDLGGEVEILNGIAAGDVVVVDGAFLLKAEAEKARGEGEHHHD
jgi:cobalt-zinc-cadmium efflux system membrane fusion protein